MSEQLPLEKKEKRFFGCNANMWVYAFGVMGINFGIGLVNSYQAEFFNKIMNVNLIAMAIIILVSKFLSIVADFIIGNLIDRANFKSGKMRPWILISTFPLCVLTMISFIFIPFTSEIGKYAYVIVILILWNVSMTLADIPSQGMLSLVSKNPEDTTNAAGMANMLRSLALGVPGIFITIVCMVVGREEADRTVYLITAGILSGIGLILQLLMYFRCKEVRKTTEKQGMSFREMFKELKQNRMILIVLGTYLLGFGRNIGLGIAVQASCILLRDGFDLSFLGLGVLYGDACSWAIGITSAITSSVTIILNPIINKKLGEKKYFIYAGFYGFVISLISFMVYWLGGNAWSGFRTIWAIWIYQFIFSFSYGPNAYLPMVMTADIVDYNEWKTGRRTEGTQFAILSMSNKLSNALSVSIGILLIGAIGYSSSDYFASLEAGTVHEYVTDSMMVKGWAIYFLTPGICMLLSSILMFFYKIDEKTKKVMREELRIRHEQQAQSASPELALEIGITSESIDAIPNEDEEKPEEKIEE